MITPKNNPLSCLDDEHIKNASYYGYMAKKCLNAISYEDYELTKCKESIEYFSQFLPKWPPKDEEKA